MERRQLLKCLQSCNFHIKFREDSLLLMWPYHKLDNGFTKRSKLIRHRKQPNSSKCSSESKPIKPQPAKSLFKSIPCYRPKKMINSFQQQTKNYRLNQSRKHPPKWRPIQTKKNKFPKKRTLSILLTLSSGVKSEHESKLMYIF